ncbi:alkaline phosphatase D family protein [Chitinibacter tainanensis]|uniref:alkaline phosphatase D family protein n=1 Tax=Chitinibacter tainanensis TaxID=230667 RepID=UPI00040004C6|nr:alkaline phosphatase D family protein [Chitinibacter tainanensis]
MDRRQFLRMAGFMTASVATPVLLSACGGASVEAPQPTASPKPLLLQFPQGVASGDPKADSLVFWTRALPAGLDPIAVHPASANSTLELIVTEGDPGAAVGTTAELTGKIVARVQLAALTEWDHSVRHKLSGLNGNTVYGYQFVAGTSRSLIGRAKTAAAANVALNQLKFAFLSCQDWSVNHWGAFDLLTKEELDFIVHLGDYIYETVGEAFQKGAVEATHPALKLPNGPYKSGNSGARYANTIDDYRALYKQYRMDPRLQQVHARFAMIAVWDDHEFSDDCWGDATTYDNGSFDPAKGGDNKHETARRRAANQAWYEFMPADVAFDANATGFQTIRLYRDFQFGQLMQLVMTDQRLYRTDHVLPEAQVGSANGSRYMVPTQYLAAAEAQKMKVAAAGGDPLALTSILGKTQRDWFKNKLKTSSAQWHFWGNEVSLLRMRLDARKLAGVPAELQQEFVLNADQWDGFNAERSDILGYIRSQNIQNVVAVTGDIHSFYAGVAHADYSQDTPAVVDLVTAGISSDSFYSYLASAVRDPSLASAQALIFTSEAGAEAIAIQMLSLAIAQQAGVSNLGDKAAIQQAVGAAIQAGQLPAAAVQATAGLATSEINTLNDLLGGGLGQTIASTIASLAARKASVAAQTLYGLVAGKIASQMQIPAANVPASAVQPFLNPFADQASGKAPVNNPWIKHADTDAQGYAVVTVTPSEVQCTFRKMRRLSNGAAPSAPLAGETRVRIASGKADVSVVS